MVEKDTKEKSPKTINVWKRKGALEIILCLLDGKPRSQKRISEETDCQQGRLSEILYKLKDKNLVSKLKGFGLPEGGKPPELWKINQKAFEHILGRVIFFKDPRFIKGSSNRINSYKELRKLITNYLKIVARLPRWRSKKWFENHIDELYLGESKEEKKEQLEAWDANMPARRPIEFNLQGLAEQFIEYLLVNQNGSEFKEKRQKEMMQLIESYHLSNNSRDLRDVDLDIKKPRLKKRRKRNAPKNRKQSRTGTARKK